MYSASDERSIAWDIAQGHMADPREAISARHSCARVAELEGECYVKAFDHTMLAGLEIITIAPTLRLRMTYIEIIVQGYGTAGQNSLGHR